MDSDADGHPYLEMQIEDSDGYSYIHERSLGFRWFFVFLLLTRYKGELSNPDSELIFLFDEPAPHSPR